MTRRNLSAPSRQTPDSSPVSHESLERRLLMATGAQNMFARTATADLNGDTLPDIVVGTTGRGRTANATPVVLIGTGPNTYAAPVPVTVPSGAGASVSIADVNADNRGDLIISGSRRGAAGTSNPNSPLLLLNAGNGTFGTATSLNVPRTKGATYLFGVGDFNNDTRADVVVEGGAAPREPAGGGTTTVPRGARQLLLMLGSGTGTFAAPVSVPVTVRTIAGMTAGNFGSTTGDDLVIAGRSTSRGVRGESVTLFRNLTSLTGPSAIPVTSTFVKITDVAAGDFNNDTRLDLVVANRGGTVARSGGVSLLTGNGDGTFAAGSPIASASAGTGTVDVGQFNADANLDVLTGAARPRGRGGFVSSLEALLNTGTGSFQTAAPITVAGT